MSDDAASLRRKIEGSRDLQSVVRTMKALAASNISQYEKSIRALDAYYRSVELGLSACFRQTLPMAVNVQRKNSSGEGVIGAVVFGSDQGLVGRFNEVVVDHAAKTLGVGRNLQVWAIGERVRSRLSDAGLPLSGLFTVPNSVNAIAPLVAQILVESERAQGGRSITELHLFYNHPTSGAGYLPVSHQLLPLDENWRGKLAQHPWPTRNLPEVMGDGATTLRALIREYLFISLFRACAESLASENATRLAAMQRADENIGELRRRIEPGRMARDLNEDARRRGL